MPSTPWVCTGPSALAFRLAEPGEPPATVAWAELIDVHDGIVRWRIEARGALALRELRFETAQSPAAPVVAGRGDFDVVQPASAAALELAPDRQYELLWRGGAWWQLGRRTDFRLDACRTPA